MGFGDNFYFLRPKVWIGELSLGAIMLETVGWRRHWDPPHDTCHTGTMGKYFQMWLIKIFFKSDISSSRKMIILTKYKERDTVSGTMAMTWTHSHSAHRCVIDNMLLFIWLSWHASPLCVLWVIRCYIRVVSKISHYTFYSHLQLKILQD